MARFAPCPTCNAPPLQKRAIPVPMARALVRAEDEAVIGYQGWTRRPSSLPNRWTHVRCPACEAESAARRAARREVR